MRRRNWVIPAAVMFGVLVACTGVHALEGKKGAWERKDGKEAGLEAKFMHKARWILGNSGALGLSDQQVQAVKDLKTSVKKSLVKQDADIELVGVDVGANLKEKKIDVNATNSLLDKKYDLKKARAKSLVKALADLKGILTDAQYDQLKKLKAEKKK